MNEDPYRILGIERHASKEEIKRAFRKKALEYHPDIHQSSPESVQKRAAEQYEKVARAYEVLSNPQRSHVHPSQGGAAPSWRPRPAGYQHTSYYRQRKRHGSVSPGFFYTFKKSGSLAITVALGCICIGGLYVFDPWIQEMWIQRNKGKLFQDMVDEIHERRKQKLQKASEEGVNRRKDVLLAKDTTFVYKEALKACLGKVALSS